MAILLAERPMVRGYIWIGHLFYPIFYYARYGIVGSKNHKKKNKANLPNVKMKPSFIHSTYHPRGIQREERFLWKH